MTKNITFSLVLFIFLTAASTANSRTISFSNPALEYLPHELAFAWGIDVSLDAGETITSASIVVEDIFNDAWYENHLWITQLDTYSTGVIPYYDPVFFNENYFAVSGDELAHYQNLPGPEVPIDLQYDFLGDNLIALSDSILLTGGVGLGFDPDCHFENSGVYLFLETTTNEVPEPATMILFGAGLAGIAALKRGRRE